MYILNDLQPIIRREKTIIEIDIDILRGIVHYLSYSEKRIWSDVVSMKKSHWSKRSPGKR